MKDNLSIVIISDTHNKHRQIQTKDLPVADIIIHCGDFTSTGNSTEINDFVSWYSNLNQYEYKIIIAGNHDFLFETHPNLAKECITSNIIYLEDSGVEILGRYFYGTPVQKVFNNWAFNRSEEKMKLHWESIPNNTDVLITHTPPHMIHDFVVYGHENVGSMSLRDEVLNRIKPQIHCFGHIHESNGITEINGIKFINASNLNEMYVYKHKPIMVHI